MTSNYESLSNNPRCTIIPSASLTAQVSARPTLLVPGALRTAQVSTRSDRSQALRLAYQMDTQATNPVHVPREVSMLLSHFAFLMNIKPFTRAAQRAAPEALKTCPLTDRHPSRSFDCVPIEDRKPCKSPDQFESRQRCSSRVESASLRQFARFELLAPLDSPPHLQSGKESVVVNSVTHLQDLCELVRLSSLINNPVHPE